MYVLDTRAATPHFPGIGRYIRNLSAVLPASCQAGESFSTISGIAPPFSISQQWLIPRHIATIGTTVYHSPYCVMPYRTGAPTVLTVYDFIPQLYPNYVSARARLFSRFAMGLALRSADRFIAISEATKVDLLRLFSVDSDSVSVIPLAADARFRPHNSAELDTLRSRFSLPEEYLLYVGINKPHKNLLTLVDAYAKLDTTLPLIIGGAWDNRYPEAKHKVEVLGLQHKVKFIGRIPDDDLPALYAGATIFLFPSFYEGFGLPVLEAMACGTPVICGNQSSLPEVVGNAGKTVDPASADALQNAISQLLNNPERRHAIGQRAIARASEFSWESTAAQTLDVYRSLLN